MSSTAPQPGLQEHRGRGQHGVGDRGTTHARFTRLRQTRPRTLSRHLFSVPETRPLLASPGVNGSEVSGGKSWVSTGQACPCPKGHTPQLCPEAARPGCRLTSPRRKPFPSVLLPSPAALGALSPPWLPLCKPHPSSRPLHPRSVSASTDTLSSGSSLAQGFEGGKKGLLGQRARVQPESA